MQNQNLEIYADDVKCSHGSTSGSLNEDSIFLFNVSWFKLPTVQGILINGFLLDVIEKITDVEIKNLIKKLLD